MQKVKIKNLDIVRTKIEKGLSQYSRGSKYIIEHKMTFFKGVFRVFIQVIFFHSVPYFIYLAFGLNYLTYLEIFSMQAILFTTVSGIPVPGSVGVSEALFMKLYGSAFGEMLLSGAMLLYRFTSFYIYIFLFMIIFFVNAAKTKNIDGKIDKDIEEMEQDFSTSMKRGHKKL